MHSSDKGIHGGDMMKMMMMTVCVGIEFSSRVLLGKENCNVMLVVVVIRCVFFFRLIRGVKLHAHVVLVPVVVVVLLVAPAW